MNSPIFSCMFLGLTLNPTLSPKLLPAASIEALVLLQGVQTAMDIASVNDNPNLPGTRVGIRA